MPFPSPSRLPLWFALTLILGAAGWTDSTIAAPATRVYAGVYLHDVTKFDQKDGVFDADLELWAKWLGDFDPENLTLANASEVDREVIGLESDGNWHSARWRVRGTLRGEFPVQKFPFDQQTISVVLELPQSLGELVPDLAGSGMRERFSVTGWLYQPAFFPRVGKEIYRSDLGAIQGEGRPTQVGRVAFEVTLRRPLVTAATKLFLPLLVILLVAFVALFVHAKELEVRASVGVTSLLACFAFHFAVADSMPNVTYITLAETLFLVSYGLCAALLCVSVAAKAFHERGADRAHRTLDRTALVAFPLILVGTGLVALPSPSRPEPSPTSIVAAPEASPPSSRSAVRIGTNGPTRPSGLLISGAANWGTTRTLPGGTPFPVLVEEVPAITNNALAFLADGRLEVTWKVIPGLLWSDGKPLTSADLRFALEVSPDSRIDNVRAVSATELVVRFKDRVAVALDKITPLPRHVLLTAFQTGGYDAVRAYREENITPSAGPYHVTNYIKDTSVTLETNPHFHGPPPSIDRIEIRRFATEPELVKAFEAGEIDMIAPNAISPEAAQDLAQRKSDAVRVSPSDLLLFLHPDLTNPILARREVRKALLKAFDREGLRKAVFGKTASSTRTAHIPVPGPLPEGTLSTSFNPESAKSELDSAGLSGTRLKLKHGPTPFDRAVVARLIQDAAAVGVILEPEEIEDPSKAYRDLRHGGLLLISRTGLRDDEPEKYWNLPRTDGRYDRTVRSDAFDEEILRLVEREERALYPERREQIRDMLFTEFSKRLPLLPLCFLTDRTVAVPELQGWNVGSGKTFGLTMERWHFVSRAENTTQ
jgi:ABC-type transport system substrate-binding protein